MITLVELENGQTAIIKEIGGGSGLKNRLEVMNIREGKKVKKTCTAPLRGPVVIEIDGCKMAIGRGMAKKVWVEEI
ncbi:MULTISPECIES: FeoA family protein [Methanobacterium]|jgi:Fe2+ transport system protein FeoA|uniref:Ferrous iron transport protein A n=1 Tax=Methanobacterium subterraneum TaxID=59277 RepID=A0A2H4VBY7_9EURY|nr:MULTISPECIES: FeoA family protein [Methanobacterium]MBW4258316.1 ferrous iron transport protein A [Methanobacterium sp. YSL]PKL73497.1 MAG: ferrous iron transport protein A [Methanobacteriales archaeon HGW-Methanobacteriales-2]AUB55607.1 iron transporter FeoA [Methanobacterium subterraneum]AUB57410.1 iron transporter FeoA [Methanobacterium sp. MZ-A1]AUB60531.1 iron transporter FeoA [Methanobacterium subterraneum]